MSAKKYTHLTFEEREQIAVWRLEGLSQSEMGRRLNRSQSAISRELARNSLPSGGYKPGHAEGAYLVRHAGARSKPSLSETRSLNVSLSTGSLKAGRPNRSPDG